MSSTCLFYSMHKRLFRHLANEHDFWNRFTFLKKHQISLRSLEESFSGNSEKISDCRAFSPFETLPGCRAFRHSLQNRRDFLRISGEQGQKRGEREGRVACVGRFAKKSRLSPYHCSSSSAPRHTPNDQPITVLEKQW